MVAQRCIYRLVLPKEEDSIVTQGQRAGRRELGPRLDHGNEDLVETGSRNS